MPTLLDIASEAVAVAQDPGKSTLAMIVSLVGSIAGIVGALRFFAERKRQRAYDKIGPVAPQPIAQPDPEREALLARVAQVERESAAARAIWKQHDAEEKLAQVGKEMDALRSALIRARSVRDELKRMNDDLRADNAALRDDIDRLRAELDSAQTVGEQELDTIAEDAERILTPLRPPPPKPRTVP